MSIKLTFPYIVAFLLLLIVMLELHEMVHITIGYLICGCWGERDFNVWELCTGCDAHSSYTWLATLSGPLFSFAMMWLGMHWLKTDDKNKKALGFSLIFANIPFGRITTVMMGGGDEMVVTRHFLKGSFSRTQMIIICSVIVFLIVAPPVISAWKALKNKNTWLYITGFLMLPLAFLLVYTLGALNTLLKNGFLSRPYIMGTPLLITLHTLFAATLLAFMRKKLFNITRPA